jgi:hypothetical protein
MLAVDIASLKKLKINKYVHPPVTDFKVLKPFQIMKAHV